MVQLIYVHFILKWNNFNKETECLVLSVLFIVQAASDQNLIWPITDNTHFNCDLLGHAVYVHDSRVTGADDALVFQDDHLSVKDTASTRRRRRVTQNKARRNVLLLDTFQLHLNQQLG